MFIIKAGHRWGRGGNKGMAFMNLLERVSLPLPTTLMVFEALGDLPAPAQFRMDSSGHVVAPRDVSISVRQMPTTAAMQEYSADYKDALARATLAGIALSDLFNETEDDGNDHF